MLVGYMRVSSDSDRQTTALQRDALLAAGVDERHLSGLGRRSQTVSFPACKLAIQKAPPG
jgi:hypothetical protein